MRLSFFSLCCLYFFFDKNINSIISPSVLFVFLLSLIWLANIFSLSFHSFSVIHRAKALVFMKSNLTFFKNDFSVVIKNTLPNQDNKEFFFWKFCSFRFTFQFMIHLKCLYNVRYGLKFSLFLFLHIEVFLL